MATDAPLTAPKRRARRKTSTGRGPQGLPTASAPPSKANVKAGQKQAQKPLTVAKPKPFVPKQDQRTEAASGTPRRDRIRKRQARRKVEREANLRVSGDRPGSDRDRGKKESADAIKAARIAYLRASRKPWVDPEAELEGRGHLADLSQKLSDAVGDVADRATPHYVKAGLPIGQSSDYGTKAVKDLVNLPAQAVPAVYVPVKAAVHAATGDTTEAKKFLKDLDEHDPVFNIVAAGVNKLKGDDKAAAKRAKRAAKAFDEHPGFAAAETISLGHGVSRGAGAVERSGALGGKVKRRARTRPVEASVEGTALTEPRKVAKGAAGRRVIKKQDIHRLEVTVDQRARAADAADPDVRATARRKAHRESPMTMSAGQIKRRVDERVQVNEDVRRLNRDETAKQVRKAIKKVDTKRARVRGRSDGGDLVSLVAQRIVKPTREDLVRYRDELETQVSGLGRADAEANKQIRFQIDRALKSKADLAKVAKAADEYKRITDPLQDQLVKTGFLEKGQADRAKLIPYAVRNMGAKHIAERVEDGERIPARVEVDGRALSNDEIRSHMKAAGVDEPAFLTQAPGQRGGRNFNVRGERPQAIRAGRRTGEATRKGTFDASRETVVENAARMQGLVDAADGFHGFVKEFSVRGKSGKPKTFSTFKQAQRAAGDAGLEGEQQYVPVRVQAFGAKKEQLDHLLETGDAEDILRNRAGETNPVLKSMLDAIDPDEGGEGPWALVPEEAAQQLRAHLNSMGGNAAQRTLGPVTNLFRQTVLGTSPTWLAGNVVEASLRTALHRAGPRSYVTGRRVLKELKKDDSKVAQEAQMRTTGGGNYGLKDRTSAYTSAEQYVGTRMESLARAMAVVRRTPGPKQVADAWGAYTDVMFGTSRLVEQQFQVAMLGKEVRSQLLDGRVRKLSRDAIKDAAEGLKNTEAQVQLGRAIDRAYGKYSKFSPTQRTFVAYYTPFIAWSLNAAKFIFDVLPRDHPVVTGLTTAVVNAEDEWRKDHGLDLFMGKGALPSFLQGSIPLSGGRHQRAPFRYTPFGFFGDPFGNLGSSVLPQVSGVLNAFEGRDWKGSELRAAGGGPADPGTKAKAAIQSFIESTIPVLAQAKRVHEKGAGSLNPFKPIEPSKSRQATGGSVSVPSGLELGSGLESGIDDGGGLTLGLGG